MMIMKDYSVLKKFQSQQAMCEILGKIHFVQGNGGHRGVNKNSQSVLKYVNVTIPAKGPEYLRQVSSGYVERSPLHFVL